MEDLHSDNLKKTIDVAAKLFALQFGKQLSREKIRWLYGLLFESMIDSIATTGKYKICNFGSFKRVFNKSRKLNNPNNKETINVDAYYTVKFASSLRLKNRLNKIERYKIDRDESLGEEFEKEL